MKEKMDGISSSKIERGKWAHSLAVLSMLVTTYYLVWRLGTFNPDAPIFSIVLYSAEVYGFITALMFYFTVWRPTRRQSPPAPPGLSVDVFIPTLNEDSDIIRKTALGCLKMTYPHKTYLLDDGKRPEIKALAKELGCEYLTRQDNKNAKAGNLNSAIKVTTGDFIALFDADHVPQPDFLEKILGYFQDEKVAFVQTPQNFYNIDSFQHRATGRKKLWSEQALFFSIIQPGKDRWNAAFFCGSCAVLRRKALEGVGGIATETITEDFHTSIKLHAAGWKSVYHNESLAYGIAPAALLPFQIQRLRWGQGTTQVFRRGNPLFLKGLTFPQRICYFASSIHYLDGFQKAVFYLTPIITLFAGLYPLQIHNIDFIVMFLPYFVLSWWAYEEMAGGLGSVLLTEQYKMIMYYTYIRSLTGIFKNRKIKFRVTPKSEIEKPDIGMMLPQIVIASLGILSVIWALVRVINHTEAEGDWGLFAGSIFWVLINTGIAGAAIRFSRKKAQRRREFRFPANLPALVTDASPQGKLSKRIMVVNDLHEQGAAITGFDKFEANAEIQLNIPLPDKMVSVKGRILHVLELGQEGASLFSYGVDFVDSNKGFREAIFEFNFNHAVNRMMAGFSMLNETPLARLLARLRRRLLPSRQARLVCSVPGMFKIKGTAENIPFVTEDINTNGMKIYLFNNVSSDDVLAFLLFSPEGMVAVQGSIVRKEEINYHGQKGWQYGVRFEIDKATRSLLGKIIGQANDPLSSRPGQ